MPHRLGVTDEVLQTYLPRVLVGIPGPAWEGLQIGDAVGRQTPTLIVDPASYGPPAHLIAVDTLRLEWSCVALSLNEAP